VMVAINAVTPNADDAENHIPLLQPPGRAARGVKLEDATPEGTGCPLVISEAKVYVIVLAQGPEPSWGDSFDPTLVGVFTTKEAALTAAKARAAKEHKDEDDGDDESNEDKSDTIGEHGAVFKLANEDRQDNGETFGIAMDAVVVDKDVARESENQELDLEFTGSGLYFNAGIQYKEIRCTKPCSICKEERDDSYYKSVMEWNNDDRSCRKCLENTSKPCSVCKTTKLYKQYHQADWETKSEEDLTCKDCLIELAIKVCSKCNVKRRQDCFSKREYPKSDTERTCTFCAKKQQRIANSRICSVCNSKRYQDEFSKKEYKKSDTERKCSSCAKAEQRQQQLKQAASRKTRSKRPPAPSAVSAEKEGSTNMKPKVFHGIKKCSNCNDRVRFQCKQCVDNNKR